MWNVSVLEFTLLGCSNVRRSPFPELSLRILGGIQNFDGLLEFLFSFGSAKILFICFLFNVKEGVINIELALENKSQNSEVGKEPARHDKFEEE